MDAIISCAAIHENEKFIKFLEKDFTPEQYEQAKEYLKNRNIGFDFDKGKSKIDRMKKDKLRQLFIASKLTKNLGDISLANKVKMSEEVDIFTYSFPCTDISLAGRQDGLSKGSGTRSGLLWECEKFIDVNKPKILLMENVKNLVQKKFINEFNEWCSVLEELGYNNYWKVLNAKNHGVPQNRERIFMVSIRKDLDCGYEFPEGFPLHTRLKDILEEDIDPKYYLSDEIVARFKAKMPSINSDIKIVESTAPESKRIGGIFDDEKGKHQAGSIWDKEYLAPTIDTCQGGYRQPLVLEEPTIVASRGRYNDEGVVEQNLEFNSEGVSNTLTTVQKDNYLAEPLLIKEATKKGYAEAYDGDSINLEQPNSQTRRGRVGTQIANTPMTSCAQGVVEGYRIRKLTPKECWTLMNFDEDAFDKVRPYMSDSALYKQAGNSIVVACMEHIFNNLDIDKIKGGNIWNIESQLTSVKTKENIG
ncbi:MAG: DNA (cytosine-5-)-methyltransferase [Cetobacterium sp.]|uniref:DNA (cytosine-5-)-methyltransferase n=1 Tax=Cetobacterium sp. TaxID=2071632 RepID=UPI003F3A2D1A